MTDRYVLTSDGVWVPEHVALSTPPSGGGGGDGGGTGGPLVMGMFNACSVPGSGLPDGEAPNHAGSTSANYAAIRTAYLNSTTMVRRCFSSSVPGNVSQTEAAHDAENGIISHLSVRGSPATMAAGGYNATVTSLANSMPAKSKLTHLHEPEDDVARGDFTAAQWRAAQQEFYTTVKSTRPDLQVGPIHMAYQWKAGMSSTANEDDWSLPAGYFDFMGIDAYYMEGQYGDGSITGMDGFKRWHDWASLKGVPLVVCEVAAVQTYETSTDGGATWASTVYYDDSQQAGLITNSLNWCAANGYGGFLYFNTPFGDETIVAAGSTSHRRDFEFTPTNSIPAGRPLSVQAWLDGCAAHGDASGMY